MIASAEAEEQWTNGSDSRMFVTVLQGNTFIPIPNVTEEFSEKCLKQKNSERTGLTQEYSLQFHIGIHSSRYPMWQKSTVKSVWSRRTVNDSRMFGAVERHLWLCCGSASFSRDYKGTDYMSLSTRTPHILLLWVWNKDWIQSGGPLNPWSH